MRSRTTPRFRRAFGKLPRRIQQQAREAYELFLNSPDHPSLRLKRIHSARDIFSVRITRAYRALGVREGDLMIWFWIGSHDEYDALIKEM